MPKTNNIVLRPRFKETLQMSEQTAIEAFSRATSEHNIYIISCIDNHVFIKLPKSERHLWTPQLHIEIEAIDDSSCLLKGLFGPNPTLWTMFMFIHFVIATLFIGFSVWTYSNHRLGEDIAIPVFLMILMVLIWFILYAFGRLGKQKGRLDMERLYVFVKSTLEHCYLN